MSSTKGNIRNNLEKISYWFFALSGLLIFWTFIAYAMNGYINNGKLDTEKLGHFGDFVGGLVGVILTTLATILLLLTYKSQKEGLKTQKKELELSRELFSKQQFENTFFNMLNVHQELRKEISFNTSKTYLFKSEVKTIKGKPFFEFAHKDFIELWEKEYKQFETGVFDDHNSLKDYKYEPPYIIRYDSNGKPIDFSIEKHLEFVKKKYSIFWKYYANYLGDYFRNIYHILKYISDEKEKELETANDSSKKNMIKEKYKKYADILQSQMSYSELFFMFYNAQTYTKVKPYIKEFDFVENLFVKNLLHPKHAKFKGMENIKTI